MSFGMVLFVTSLNVFCDRFLCVRVHSVVFTSHARTHARPSVRNTYVYVYWIVISKSDSVPPTATFRTVTLVILFYALLSKY